MVYPIAMTMTYTETAEQFLQELLALREQKAAIDRDIKAVHERLSICLAQGDLNHLKEKEGSNTLKFQEALFIFNGGTITWDYSSCSEIKLKEDQLKALKKTVQAVTGMAIKKIGKPFWTVRS